MNNLRHAPWTWNHLEDKLNLEALQSYQAFRHHIQNICDEDFTVKLLCFLSQR